MKVLFVATVYKFLNFEKSDMEMLKGMGYEVHTATNMSAPNWLNDDGTLDYLGLNKHQIDFGRSPFSKNSILAYKQLKKLFDEEYYDLIHCHTPVAATICRLAAINTRKKGTKVIYTDHGFHFHKTSGIKNWLLFYPVEYIMAFFTDMIITINKEDWEVIQKFHVEKKRYIPGVGVDVEYIANKNVNRLETRKEFGIPEDAFTILSIGELSIRKNQEVIIKAIADINSSNIYYVLCGTGDREEYLRQLSKKLGIEDKVIFTGYQTHDNVIRLAHAIDLGALPSLIEGLGLAGIEIMSAGKPVVASNVHGIKDYVINGVTGITCSAHDVDAFKCAIEQMYKDKLLYDSTAIEAIKKAKDFDIKKVKSLMYQYYNEI